jgi:hypothetical protein
MVPGPVIFLVFLHAEDVFDRCRKLLVAADVGADERRHFLNRRHPHVVKDQNPAQIEDAVRAEKIYQGVVERCGRRQCRCSQL